MGILYICSTLFICVNIDLPCVVLQSRISQFWRHQNGSPRWYLATIEAIHQFLMELHTVAWNMNSGNLRAESMAMGRNGQKTQEISTCVKTSKNIDTADRDAKQDISAADKISHLCGTSNENGTGEHSNNPDCFQNEHKKISDTSECLGPYKGEYDNLLFFFCYMYNKIHKLYDHEDLRAYKRPLK